MFAFSGGGWQAKKEGGVQVELEAGQQAAVKGLMQRLLPVHASNNQSARGLRVQEEAKQGRGEEAGQRMESRG